VKPSLPLLAPRPSKDTPVVVEGVLVMVVVLLVVVVVVGSKKEENLLIDIIPD